MSSIGTHPKNIQGFDESQATNHYQAIQVYIDLSECKDWWNLEVRPCTEKTLLFISGHETQFEPQTFVLPIRSDAELSVADLDVYKKVVKDHFNSDTFLLGIVDSDSAVVYYRISDGLVPPERPEELEAKKLKSLRYRERRKQRNMKYTNIAGAMSLKKELHLADKASSEAGSSSQSNCNTKPSACHTNSPQHTGHLIDSQMDSFNTTDLTTETNVTAASTSKSQLNAFENDAVESTTGEKQGSLFDNVTNVSKVNEDQITHESTCCSSESNCVQNESNCVKSCKERSPASNNMENTVGDSKCMKESDQMRHTCVNKSNDHCRASLSKLRVAEKYELANNGKTTSFDSYDNTENNRKNGKCMTESDPIGHSCTDGQSHLGAAETVERRNQYATSSFEQMPSTDERLLGAQIHAEDEGHASSLEANIFEPEESVDETVHDPEVMEADDILPNMAPEDFEDVEYTDDEFAGEL